MTAFVLDPGVYEMLCTSFRSEVSISPVLWGARNEAPLAFKARFLGDLPSGEGPPGYRTWHGARTPASLGEPVQSIGSVGHPPGDVRLNRITGPPFPCILLWALLHIFCGNRSSLAGSSLFIGGGSAGSCDAGVLLGGALRSFCSAVLAGLLHGCK